MWICIDNKFAEERKILQYILINIKKIQPALYFSIKVHN